MAQPLSQQKTAHALRHFIIIGGLFGIYLPNVLVGSTVFTGFALSLGVTESQIAFLAALTGLMRLGQPISAYWTRRVGDKRKFCSWIGVADFTAASSVILCIYLPDEWRFTASAVLLTIGYMLGSISWPIFMNWMANVVPEGIRATYVGRRRFILTLVSAGYIFIASRWLDATDGLSRFVVLYLAGWIAGLVGYWILSRTAFPPMEVDERQGYGREVLAPLRQRSFSIIAAFMATWALAMAIASPFYSIYMLNYLKLTYMHIAVYTNIALIAMLVGFRAIGTLAERFGCKPMMRILIVPAMAVPFIWGVAGEGTWPYLIPIACVLSGFSLSGLEVAGSALLYRTVPKGRDNSMFFGLAIGGTAIGTFVGAMAGGFIKGRLGTLPIETGIITLAPPQVMFLLAATVFLVPVVIVQFLEEPDAETVVGVLSKFRGNVFGLAYNYVLYNVSREGRRRADAVRGMGKSRSPLAVGRLSESLDDASPEVRHEAALGLGDVRVRDAVPPLLKRLTDGSSDIRPEAAEALGQIGDAAAIDPLREALRDGDARLRCSAAIALGEIGGPAARDLLIERLSGEFDRPLVPALVDAAGRAGDLRVVDAALPHLPEYANPVIRMQIINGICRALGERNHFYQLASRQGVARGAMIEPMMKRVRRMLRRGPGVPPDARTELAQDARAIGDAMAEDDHVGMGERATELATRVLDLPKAGAIAHAGARALQTYIHQAGPGIDDEARVVVVIVLTSIARHLGQGEPGDSPAP